MRRIHLCLAASLAAFCAGGCGGGRPIHYYTVEAPATAPAAAQAFQVALLIGRIGAPGILQDEPIVYRSGPNEIGTYGYHQWVEPPVQMLRIALLRQLRASGRYQSVAELGSSAQGEYVLHGRLYDFEEVDTGGITGLVTMEFELTDRNTGKNVWRHFYSHSEPAQGKEISDVVSALDRNLRRGVNEVAAGLDGYFSSQTRETP